MSSRSYCFTSFNDEIYPNMDKIRYIIYQPEMCPKTNKIHLQGYLELFQPTTIGKVKQFIGDLRAHLEIRQGTRDQARNYCMKTKSKHGKTIELGNWNAGGQGKRTDLQSLVELIEEGISDYELIKQIPETVERYRTFIKHTRSVIEEHKHKEYLKSEFHTELPLRPIQTKILEHIANQNDRQISWVTDHIGGCGKTWLSKYCIATMNAIRFTNGKTKDIAYAYNNEPLVVFDFSRSNEDRINYQILEDLKNGILFSCKYESRCKIFQPPKIIVMSNFLPDLTKLSKDRWDLITA